MVSLPGSIVSVPRSGNTTCDVHSPVSFRSNLSVIGMPACIVTISGEYPPLTVMVAC